MSQHARLLILPSILGALGAQQCELVAQSRTALTTSVLQTQTSRAVTGLKEACEESEVECGYFSWLPLGHSCASRQEGCPVSCGTGEHVCRTPPMCETCHAVNYCSSQPCPVVCGFGTLVCEDISKGSVSCADVAEGCPINCSDGAYSCHSPPTCVGCPGRNWCSSAPCPAVCTAGEISCNSQNGSYCVPFQKGCPANCSKHEYPCHIPGQLAGEAGFNFCSSTPCSPACNTSQLACADSNGSEVCVSREQGCPVTCNKHEHTCHRQPECETCIGMNWCSTEPCPKICSSHEISCTRQDGSNFCAARAEGCPVNCSKEEHACHWDPHPPGNQGLNWCSKKKCPKLCNATQLACAEEDGGQICVKRAEGCPVKCKKHEHHCHAPPSGHDGAGLNWCSAVPCPVNCSKEEVACPGVDQAYVCYDRKHGCPANCHHSQHVCHSAPKPSCADCVAVNWCSQEPCPQACGAEEITCPLHNRSGTFCALLAQGCPVHCGQGQHACHAPPACEGCTGTNWCSAEPCPLVCASTDMPCVALNGTEFCVAVNDGCPVTCRDEDYICHMPPQCQECVGMNWCSAAPCATSV